jgi:hypothetical protein
MRGTGTIAKGGYALESPQAYYHVIFSLSFLSCSGWFPDLRAAAPGFLNRDHNFQGIQRLL